MPSQQTTTSYLELPTRSGHDGALDKAALAVSLSEWTAHTNREFLTFVRRVVNGAGSAKEQADKWFDFLSSRSYSREFGDVFAHPSDTSEVGGDCDDLAIALMAGLISLGIPTTAEIIENNGSGIHIRVRAGFPPHDPPKDLNLWTIYDPTKKSEPLWIGSESLGNSPNLSSTTFSGIGLSSTESKYTAAKVGLAILASFIVYKIATANKAPN